MIQRQHIQETIYDYIARQMNCSPADLSADGTVFIKDEGHSEKYIKILSIRDADIVTLSPDIYPEALTNLAGKNRDELYESDYVFGQTLHYVPDLNALSPLPYPGDLSFELLTDDDVRKLQGITGFDNSLVFDEAGDTPTCIVLYARNGDEIIALAGASYVNEELREVGIDVKKPYRGKNLATLLVRNLTIEILKRDKIPFYSASVTNIASQAVAFRSGYMPLWTDTFGVRELNNLLP